MSKGTAIKVWKLTEKGKKYFGALQQFLDDLQDQGLIRPGVCESDLKGIRSEIRKAKELLRRDSEVKPYGPAQVAAHYVHTSLLLINKMLGVEEYEV